MLGGENFINFFQTPLVENPYQLDLSLNAPSQPKLLDTELNINLSQRFFQQQSVSQEAASYDLCSLSLGHNSNWLDCSLNLGLLNQNHNSNQSGVSTSLGLCLPDYPHERYAGTASTSQEMFPMYNDLRADINRHEDDLKRFIQQKEAEMYREYQRMREQQATSLVNSIGRLFEQKMIHKNLQLEQMYLKNRELMEKVNEAAAETGHWQYQALQSQTALITLQTEMERAREECGENDAASYVAGRDEGDMATRCLICKTAEARILHLPCRHLSVCAECDDTISACPMCFSMKTQSIEVFLH